MAKKKQVTGRKRVALAEKVILVGFYTKKRIIDAVGGMEKARQISKECVEARASA